MNDQVLDNDAVLTRAAELKAERRPFALITVVRCEPPTSAKPGAKALVEPDGRIQGWIGGGCAQPAVIKTAKQALGDGEPRLIRISPNRSEAAVEGIVDFGMSCHSGGTLDIFIDPVVLRPQLLVIGGSPAARSLVALGHHTGFEVTAAFPEADAGLFPEADHVVPDLRLGAASSVSAPYIVVATQGKRDEEGLEAALSVDSRYLAFIASERKADKLKGYLKERGYAAERVDAIVAPAGVQIGASTPEEIALSVMGAVIAARRLGRDGIQAAAKPQLPSTAGTQAACCGDESTAEAQSGMAVDPVCGMSVEVATAEYRSEHAGQVFYFCCAHCQHSFEKAPERYAA